MKSKDAEAQRNAKFQAKKQVLLICMSDNVCNFRDAYSLSVDACGENKQIIVISF